MSSLQSPSQVRHLSLENYSAFSPHIKMTSSVSPTYLTCGDRVPIIWAGMSSETRTSAESVVSSHDHSPTPKMTTCLGRGSGMWTWKHFRLDLLWQENNKRQPRFFYFKTTTRQVCFKSRTEQTAGGRHSGTRGRKNPASPFCLIPQSVVKLEGVEVAADWVRPQHTWEQGAINLVLKKYKP